jgi:hypothetical protein
VASGFVAGSEVLAAGVPVLAVAAVEFPVAVAELAEAVELAAAAAFEGPSSAPANLHVAAKKIIAATIAPLRHPKHSELNRTLIPKLPPR